MIIRQEETKDYDNVYNVVKTAFATSEHSNGTEQDLVNALRKSEAFIPQLSLVAEIDGNIVGHIMFTKVKINESTQLALAPLSVLPQYQRQGVGKKLIQEGHRIAQDMGYAYSIVLGSEKYYPRFKYEIAEKYGIKAPFDVPNENFMAHRLSENAPIISGTVKYAKEFGIE